MSDVFEGSLEENLNRVLPYLGLEKPEDVDIAQIRLCPDPEHPKGHTLEDVDSIVMVLVAFLNKQNEWSLQRWCELGDREKNLAHSFFAGEDAYDCFLQSLSGANCIRSNQTVED